MIASNSRWLRRRLSVPTSGSARRRARQRVRAQQTQVEGERLARERRDQRHREKLENQRQAREELASYEPWGRAGGGAPNAHGIRYTNLRDTGIYPEDELRGIAQYEPCRRWPSPRRRRRTPLRLREDPQLCYADNLRSTVDNDIRYRRTPDQQHDYKQILDEMVDRRNKILKDDKRRDKEYDRALDSMEGPWGKPGPGGAVWRDPRDVGLNFSKSMGWTDNETFDKIQGDHTRTKRTSLTLPQVKKDDDSREPQKENVRFKNVETLPDIRKNNSPNCKKTESKNGVAKEDTKCSVKNTNKKRSPKKGKFVKRLTNGERVERVVPDDIDGFVRGEVSGVVEKKLTPEASILRLTGGVELVPLLARRRRVGARTLHSSDVTRPPDQSCHFRKDNLVDTKTTKKELTHQANASREVEVRWREILNEDYLRDLKQQIRVKCAQLEDDSRDSAERVRQHHATWSSLWGRPGHGAPQRGRYARSNLAQLLYVDTIAER